MSLIKDLASALAAAATKTNPPKILAMEECDGIKVITADVPGLGFETAIVDAASAYVVDKYPTEMDARRGHTRWAESIRDGASSVTELAVGDKPSRIVRLLRESQFANVGELAKEDVRVEILPYLRRTKLIVKDETIYDGPDDDYVAGYVHLLERMVFAPKTAPALRRQTPIKTGDIVALREDGSVQVLAGTSQKPTLRMCGRLVDQKDQAVPPGDDMDTCTRCSALVVYNPDQPYQDLPKVCVQCVEIERSQLGLYGGGKPS